QPFHPCQRLPDTLFGLKVEKISIPSKEVREFNIHIAKNCDNLLISRDKSLLEELVKITNIDK
ncbi:unnamed protein product, partial [marine sediment metagenome]